MVIPWWCHGSKMLELTDSHYVVHWLCLSATGAVAQQSASRAPNLFTRVQLPVLPC